MTARSDIRALVAASPLPMILVGPEERILADNARAVALIGHEAIGRHYITALRQPSVLDAVEQCFADGKTRTTRYLGSEGKRDTTWRVTSAGVQMEMGRAVLLTFEDVTALEEASQMRRDFVANVSHELRTPLTALLGFVETLKGPARDDPEARDRFLDAMTGEAGRMARLVEDLLSLSRVEEAERMRPRSPVEMVELLRGSVELMQPRAEAAGVTLVLETPDPPVSIPGDEGQLRQVLTNLIENAIKYGAGGERIEVRLSGPRQESALRAPGVRLSVRDHGEGIAAHHVARLTERFYRVDTHRSRDVGGTGLGLAIVKHIVNRHRGRLRIESEPGKGSRFTAVLPAE